MAAQDMEMKATVVTKGEVAETPPFFIALSS